MSDEQVAVSVETSTTENKTALLPAGFNPRKHTAQRKLSESPKFKLYLILAAGAIGSLLLGFVVTLFTKSANQAKPIAPVRVKQESFDNPMLDPADNSDVAREDIAVGKQRELNAAAMSSLEAEEKAKKARQKPGHRLPPPRQAPRIPVASKPITVSRPPTPRPAPPRSISPPPRLSVPQIRRPQPTPQPQPSASPTVSAPEPKPSKPVDTGMIAFGEVPTDAADSSGSGGESDYTETSFEEGGFSEDQFAEEDSGLWDEQQGFLAGRAQSVMESGTQIKGEIMEEAIAGQGATFAVVTREDIPGMPQGSEIIAQVVQASGSDLQAEAIAVKHRDGQESSIPPGAMTITKSNGDLLKMKGGKKKFLGGELGSLVKNTLANVGQRSLNRLVDGAVGGSDFEEFGNVIVDRGFNGGFDRGNRFDRSSSTEEPTEQPRRIGRTAVRLNVKQPFSF